MTRIIYTVLLISAAILHVNGQKKKEPEFATAGEHEAYWAKQLFENEYKKQKHSKFSGKIKRLDAYTFIFDTVKLRVINTSGDLLPIFDEGLLQPWGTGTTISNIVELTNLNPSQTVKRFKFLMYMKRIGNPTVYFFELTNKAASKTTDLKTFIKGSRLTFLKQGWVMI
jgi:hypothetical protein